VEYSIERSLFELEGIRSSAADFPWRLDFLKNNFLSLLLLISTGDLIAVEDSLFSERTVTQMKKGYELLQDLLSGSTKNANEELEGFERFNAFLSDKNKDETRENLEEFLNGFGYPHSEFWKKFFLVQEFNFTLSLVPHLPQGKFTLLIFIILFKYIDENVASNLKDFSNIRIVFDHTISSKFLFDQICMVENSEVLTSLLIQKTKNCWELNSLVITNDGSLVNIKKHAQ
jgi:hypothetical protein